MEISNQELRSWWEILVDIEDTLNETLGMFNRESPVADQIEKAIGEVSRVRKKVDSFLKTSKNEKI